MTNREHLGGQVVNSLRKHVLAPLSDAQSLVQQEREEVDAERQAFQRFKDRVAGIQPMPPPTTTPTNRTVSHPVSQKADRLRNAYRETVMGVDHYDDVYSEPLDTNVAAELSPAVATGLQRNGTRFTDMYKTRLTDAISQAIAQREAFSDDLTTEHDSLGASQEELMGLLDPLDGPRIPAWHTTEFEDALADLVATRQATIQSRTLSGHVNGHDLCAYLYDDPAWTYPVLTAVARLRGAVTYRTEHDQSATHI